MMAGASVTAMSRRDFLVRGAAGLGCLAWEPGARGFSSPVTSPLRIGVIGGEPAAAVWREALARLDGAALAAHWRTATEWMAGRVCLSEAKIDGVIIAAPDALRPKLACDVLDAGCHAAYAASAWPGAAEARTLDGAAARSGKALHVLPSGSKWGVWLSLRRIIEEGRLGAPRWSQAACDLECAGMELPRCLAGVMLATGESSPVRICSAGAYENGGALLTLEYANGHTFAVACRKGAAPGQPVVVRGAYDVFEYAGGIARLSGREVHPLRAESVALEDWLASVRGQMGSPYGTAFTLQLAQSIARAEDVLRNGRTYARIPEEACRA